MRRLPAPSPFLKAFCGCVLALLFAGAAILDNARLFEAGHALLDVNFVDLGERLLHRLPGSAYASSFYLPVSSVAQALLSRCRPESVQLAFLGAALFWELLLAALGAALGGWTGALAALALAAALKLQPFGAASVMQSLASSIVLVVAGLWAWREREPSLKRDLALGTAVGCSFLFRSNLAFLPPVFAAWLLRPGRRPGRNSLLALALWPYLFTLPWLWMNHRAYREWVPFEYKAASANVVTGALGIVPAVEGDWRPLVKDPDFPADGRQGGVLGWAVREVLRHPLRYVLSCLGRVRYAAGAHPLLFLLGLLSAWMLRRRPPAAAVAVLSAYILGVQCLMSVHPEYFIPLWPLLAALVGGLAGAFVPAPAAAPPAAARALAASGLAALAGLYLCAAVPVVGYGLSAGRTLEAAREEALRRSPGDPWLWSERGRARLALGELAGARSDFARSAALGPDERRELALDRALALSGLPRPLLDFRGEARLSDHEKTFLHILRAESRRALGQAGAARGELAEAWRLRRAELIVRRLETERERQALRDLALGAEGAFAADVLEAVRSRPPAKRAELLSLLPEEVLRNGGAQVYLGVAARQAGKPELARSAFAKAERSELDAEQVRSAALTLQDAKDYPTALALLELLVRRSPKDARLLKDRGVCRWFAGQKDEAARDLEAALSLEPGLKTAALSLGAVYEGSGRRAEALAVYERALSAKGNPDPPVESLLRESRDALLAKTRNP